jgi:hypothetical protein
MASSYKSEYPSNTAVDEGIIQFFETFYELSDTPGAHDKYAESFTESAVLIMASKRCDGYAGRSILFPGVRMLHTASSLPPPPSTYTRIHYTTSHSNIA